MFPAVRALLLQRVDARHKAALAPGLGLS